MKMVCRVELDNSPPIIDKNFNREHWPFSDVTKKLLNVYNNISGTYIWRFGDQYKYVGETKNLKDRVVNQYSYITKELLETKQRMTNRKINAAICAAIKDGKEVRLYFYETKAHYKDVEQYLLQFKSQSFFNLNEMHK